MAQFHFLKYIFLFVMLTPGDTSLEQYTNIVGLKVLFLNIPFSNVLIVCPVKIREDKVDDVKGNLVA